jgi:AraC family transcriptional regulator
VIRGGTYGVAHFEIRSDHIKDACDAVSGGWLPERGYQPDDGPCYVLCLNNPEKHPDHIHILNICVPIKSLYVGPLER